MIKLKHFLIFLILSWAAIGYCQQKDSIGTENLPGPGLVFNEPKHDFGVVVVDSIVTHIYTFKNASRDTIKINKVTSS